MAIQIIEKDGRKWSGPGDAENATRVFQIVTDSVGSSPAMTYTGLPLAGSAHPSLSGLVASKFSFDEGKGSEKGTIICTVEYSREESETTGSGTAAEELAVEQWGWAAGTEEKELMTATDGTPVRNSAGDPFDAVPRVSSPSPTFTKVMKFKRRQSGAMGFNCKVNDEELTIGDMTCPAGSLLAAVSEERIFSDSKFKYRYTVQLKFKSNLVKLNGSDDLTDIGWDVAITDAGMRELGDNNELVIIRQIDKETGKRATVTSPELLDGFGHAVDRSYGRIPEPYNFRFKAYEGVEFPSWFYSEPN